MPDPAVAPAGYVTERMSVRDAIVSPDEAIRHAVGAQLRVAWAQYLEAALNDFMVGAMDTEFIFYRAPLN